ncbi:MAG: YceI family protein [Tenacibaculum sp.]
MRVLFLFLLISQTIFSQKYFTRTGVTEFKASTDAFEPVEAINKSSSVILKVNTGEIAALLPIKGFNFKVALMQEHFNENYMDSHKFPKATFKGKIKDFNINSIKKEYAIKGLLTIKGISKTIETKARITKSESKLILETHFVIKPQDFNIKIPSIVRKKIANNINVYINYELIEKI